ncbi:unnamed protein product, partial [Mesorhabditis spiculigera]
MSESLARSMDLSDSISPITALCVVADKNKAPRGFTALTKSNDDASDADLWHESSFSIFSRPVRYLCYSREKPNAAYKGSISVVTDITVVKENDPIPHGFVAIDYTADSRERALRKRFICVKTEPLDAAVDAVGEVIILNKNKKTPKDYTNAGEVDGAMICFRVIVIPSNYGLSHSASERNLSTSSAPGQGLYPSVPGLGQPSHSTSALSQVDPLRSPVNAFTIKQSSTGPKPIDGVEFKVNPLFECNSGKHREAPLPPFPEIDLGKLDSDEYTYRFQIEQSALSY